MIPALSRIWEVCFGDSPEYIRFFMERRFSTSLSFVWLEDGEPVGVVYLLPSWLRGERSYYSYAGGVLPEHRGKGYGKAMLRALARLAVERGCGRLEWSCLDWNTPSIDFYLSLRAMPMEEWTTYRLTGETLKALAES